MSKSAITPLLKYEIVEIIKANVFPTYANTYLGIGRPVRWGDASDPELATEIEEVTYTTDYVNQTFRDMIAMKKIAAADTALVVPRVDWVSGTVYDTYDDDVELFSFTDKLTLSGTVNASANVITTNTAVFTGSISVGNTVTLNSESRQVIGVNTTHLVVNTNFNYAVTDGTLVRTDNTYPRFANTFYVRNSKDQVFKCLYSGGVASTIEPTIDIDGQLPENPFIETADTYKWKYLYTIPYGLKQKFFTKNWMPVLKDNSVVAGSVDGRIDVVEILSGGTGYFLNNGESGNSNSYSIITISGDGTGASVTAKIESGVITEINVLNGGSGYTYANVIVYDVNQLDTGAAANLNAIISPSGGHGSNPFKELGCYSVMVSVDLVGTESGVIPVSGVNPFDYRQLTLIRDPKLANGYYATGSTYRTSTKLKTTNPGDARFLNDEEVYVQNLETSEITFRASVVYWDNDAEELYVNNLWGTPATGDTLNGSLAGATILTITEPDIDLFTGDILYIENRDKIIRDIDQTEQIRLVLSF